MGKPVHLVGMFVYSVGKYFFRKFIDFAGKSTFSATKTITLVHPSLKNSGGSS